MISYQPLHNPKLNCSDDIIATIAKEENIDFELFLSESWGFQLLNNDNGLIGNRIRSNSRNNFDILKNAHGITYKYVNLIFKTTYLKEVFDKYKYISVCIDTYYCPWDKNYLTFHNPEHTVLIDEVDYKENIIYLTDPFYEKKHESISFSHFNNMVGYGWIISVDKTIKQIKRNHLKKLLWDNIKITELDILNIENLAQIIGDIDIALEVDGYENIWHTPIIFSMGRLALGRLRYSVLLEYLNRKYSFDVQDEIKMLENVADLWHVIRTILVKCSANKYDDEDAKRIQTIMLNILNIEKKACINLSKIYK